MPKDYSPEQALNTSSSRSSTADALAAAGDHQSAEDIGDLDQAIQAADQKHAGTQRSLVERLIYGPPPAADELQAGGKLARRLQQSPSPIVEQALACQAEGKAFTAGGKLSSQLRKRVAREKAYGYTVPVEYNGAGKSYAELACIEEQLAANGLGALAVEISGQLTIGAGAIIAYGDEQQKSHYLPLIADGRLIAFALTEVGVGVNAKKIQAYVEEDAQGNYRLFAHDNRNKLWITNAIHGGLVGLVARLGEQSRDIGLFIIDLPKQDIEVDDEHDYAFRCQPSGVAAFSANHNSRLHFHNYPIPKQNRIPADGVEVLFYCLRMGRCLLAAMSAGYQRMLACDAAHYARQRIGVGGPIIKHELPRLALGKMLGGSLQSRALAYLALQQDADGADLAGLRDITKSAAAAAGVASMIACEHVMGGRSFHQGSRVNEARINLHLFSIVEGEDDMIRMGMVRDITLRFVDTHLSSLLKAINAVNNNTDGSPLPPEQRILRLGFTTLWRYPGRSFTVIKQVFTNPDFWRLTQWCLKNIGRDLSQLPARLIPASLQPRYQTLPSPLRHYACYAERKLRGIRWRYLGLSLYYQLELTRAQIPLQRLGKRIEDLVSILTICHHAASQDVSQQKIAAIQTQLLKDKITGFRLLPLRETRRLQHAVATLGNEIEQGDCSLLADIRPAPFGHPWK